jgi:tetratricopeptide (TPR) repeat protein
MASYKKRGNRPKTKKEKEEQNQEQYKTAEVFSNLDEGANRTERWLANNQKPILVVLAIVVVGILAYIGYNRFIVVPTQEEAASDMSRAQTYFNQAMQAPAQTQSDSLYDLALNGGGGNFGFLDIQDNYGGTDSGNLAHYYAGMAYLNMGQNKKAVAQLEEFSADDEIVGPIAIGAMGDAFMQNDQPEKALGYYEEAANKRDNQFTTPRFLMKAAQTALQLKQAKKAEKYLTKIEKKYPESSQAAEVEGYLGMAQAMQ